MSSPAPSAALAPGQRFDRYTVVRCLSQGAMGAIYEVVHTETNGRAALKVLLPSLVGSEELRERFKREAMIGANIPSEHVVRTFDAGVDRATQAPFLAMELLEGTDLERALAARRHFTPGEVVTFLHQAGLALDRAHALGVVHRDLKPGNLFLTRGDDGSPRVKVLDFGIAKVVAEENGAMRTTNSVGTPVYMAPEQILDQAVGPPADRYALAHVAYALLVGRPYWAPEAARGGSLLALLGTIAQGPREPASARAQAAGVVLPPGFDAWFARATALDPAARFARASGVPGPPAGLIEELARALGVPAPQAAWSAPLGPAVEAGRAGTSGSFTRDTERAGRGRAGLWLAVSVLGLGGVAALIGLAVSGAGTGDDTRAAATGGAASGEPAASSAPIAAATNASANANANARANAGANASSSASADADTDPSASTRSSGSGAPAASTATASGSRPAIRPTGPRPGYDPTKIR